MLSKLMMLRNHTSHVMRRSCVIGCVDFPSRRVFSSGSENDENEDHNIRRTMTRKSQNASDLFDMISAGEGQISRQAFATSMRQIGLENLVTLQRSLARGELSRTSSSVAAVNVPFSDEVNAPRTPIGTLLANRFGITFEVAVSKIFPAGFGWQYASCIAEAQLGFSADSAQFALCTGVGDGLGVMIGHTTYYALKKAVTGDQGIDMGAQAQTGLLLGSAAFCSGTVWQPTVDMLTASGMSFTQVATGTTMICGLAFYAGLRLFRLVYGKGLGMTGVEENSYSNLKADALLSLSIGGATGAFVGTDVSFGDGNWLRPLVGIEDGVADLPGAATAGASTAMGFLAFQTCQNVVEKEGKNWVD